MRGYHAENMRDMKNKKRGRGKNAEVVTCKFDSSRTAKV